MDAAALRERLRETVRPYHLDDLEIDEHVERLSRYPHRTQERVLEMAASIWPVSHALAFQFLNRVDRGISVLGEAKLSIWVGAALDAYEESGLDEARLVLDDGGRALLAYIDGKVGLRFQDVSSSLLPYLCGLAERSLDLEPAERAGTDTATVYLPPRLRAFGDNDLNYTLYKYAVSFQWGMIRGGTYRACLPPGHPLLEALEARYGRMRHEGEAWLENFFRLFPEPGLARELFHLSEALRIRGVISRELPGLHRDASPVLERLLAERKTPADPESRAGIMGSVRRQLLGASPQSLTVQLRGLLAPLRSAQASAADSLEAAWRIYLLAEPLVPGKTPSEPLFFEGELLCAEAERARRRRREELGETFVEALALFIEEDLRVVEDSSPAGEKGAESFAEQASEDGATVVARPDRGEDDGTRSERRYLKVGTRQVEIPEDLARMAREIEEDLGHLPAVYVSGALAMAGRARGDIEAPPEEEGSPVTEPVRYDEWDFRRSGFRKNWCLLHELEMEPADYSFVPEALRRYRGQLGRIRRHFELMRFSERFLKRQRDGEEIDIDAATEALADLRAGRPMSDRLFIRLVRDRRDIATLFLVDMSSSTEGWVNQSIKESLVLLCEALSILGDRYAIYGFSGVKRLRSEFYHIKHFEEPYDSEVKGRIAAIRPMDYTRMGPPIRHSTEILKRTESRVRLLVTLSDGRPEDYDDYRGEYSIEDTRHALIEAKTDGIHPFCITIDREARDYISHMYGEVNYIVIDDVKKLPVKMPEIYRALTT